MTLCSTSYRSDESRPCNLVHRQNFGLGILAVSLNALRDFADTGIPPVRQK